MRGVIGAAIPLLLLGVVPACHGPAQPALHAGQITSAARPAKSDEGHRQKPESRVERGVDIGDGFELHIQCEGGRTPVVVFDSGLGQGAEAWVDVQQPVARVARACTYDRAGHGRSDPPKLPHSNRQMARELFALLANAGEPGPYVLVGHSMGGTNVQLFLAEHPASVAGMVLLDASPEPPPFDQIPPAAMAEFERNIARLEGLDVKTLLAGFEELRASNRSLGNKPLAIVVAGLAQEDPNITREQAQSFFTARQQSQKALLGLSTNSVFVTAHQSAHHVPRESPEIVIRAVEAVVEAVRTGSTLVESSVQGASRSR